MSVSSEHGVDDLRDLRGAAGTLRDSKFAHVHQVVGPSAVRRGVRVDTPSDDASNALRGRAVGSRGRVRRALHQQDRVAVREPGVVDALIVFEHASAVDEPLRQRGDAADLLDHALQHGDVDLFEAGCG